MNAQVDQVDQSGDSIGGLPLMFGFLNKIGVLSGNSPQWLAPLRPPL